MKTIDHFWHVLLVVYVRHGWVEYLWAGGNNLWIIRHDKGADSLHMWRVSHIKILALKQ